jgi:hypothetical protein
VNHQTISQGLFDSPGLTLFLNQIFLLSYAGLGAAFAALNQLNEFIKLGTYEPKFDASYWARIIMGLMSGLIISELLPLNALNLQDASGIQDFEKPLAALLGGFASDMLYRILNRLVEQVNQLFGGGSAPKHPLVDHRLPNQTVMPPVVPPHNQAAIAALVTSPVTAPSEPVQAAEALPVTDKPTLAKVIVDEHTKVTVGLLTYEAEGQEDGPYHSRKLHVPADSSGLTIGRGYDMKYKDAAQISTELSQAGVPDNMATQISNAAGLSGAAAKSFIDDNQLNDFEVSMQTQQKLFAVSYAQMTVDVQRICAKADCVAAYGAEDWQNLDSKIKAVVVDLRYRGDYTSQSRKYIQQSVATNNFGAFCRVLSTTELWKQVPPDRFKKRVGFLQS